jgi:hypothetical protein
VLLSGTFVEPSSFDLPKWAAWLAGAGYDNKAGWDTLMDGIRVRACCVCCGGGVCVCVCVCVLWSARTGVVAAAPLAAPAPASAA